MIQTEGSEKNEEGFLCQSEPLFPSLSSVKDFFRDSQAKNLRKMPAPAQFFSLLSPGLVAKNVATK
jgi:hypothetical protein